VFFPEVAALVRNTQQSPDEGRRACWRQTETALQVADSTRARNDPEPTQDNSQTCGSAEVVKVDHLNVILNVAVIDRNNKADQ